MTRRWTDGADALFDEEAAVSVVGTSDVPLGAPPPRSWATSWRSEGAVVVSAFAKGIDGASHRAPAGRRLLRRPCWAAA